MNLVLLKMSPKMIGMLDEDSVTSSSQHRGSAKMSGCLVKRRCKLGSCSILQRRFHVQGSFSRLVTRTRTSHTSPGERNENESCVTWWPGRERVMRHLMAGMRTSHASPGGRDENESYVTWWPGRERVIRHLVAGKRTSHTSPGDRDENESYATW